MNDMHSPLAASTLKTAYDRDGYYFPYDVASAAHAAQLLADLEAAEAECAGDRAKLSLLRSYPSQLLPSFAALIRHPRLIDAVTQIIGRDVLVWSCGFFIKEAGSKSFVSWHQDLNYWGLDGDDEVTAWYALTPATVETGCMRFVAGSHRQKDVPHVDKFAPDNLLTRGQELAVKVDEASAVDVLLNAGQASLHHGHLFHASGPNLTNARRLGVAIRYVAPSMKQTSGDKLLVSHVAGEDRYGNFEHMPPPAGRLQPEDWARAKRNADMKKEILYKGVKDELVKVNRRG
ncbi:MAG: phytanoyl-CoA dioxygenase family protein [Betaproteobacteria bacterium]|nr:phytanoyl-CoA dioxygenase family protein [Betaproteobacteria bacterium]